jgi:ankyrin repeat protein
MLAKAIVTFVILSLSLLPPVTFGDTNPENKTRYLLFKEAVRQGKIRKVKAFIKEGVELNGPKNEDSPLHVAVFNRNLTIVKLLIKAGADVNQVDVMKNSPLHQAVGMFGKLSIVKALVEGGAKLNQRGMFGRTPIMEASANGKLKIVKYLISRGANIQAKTCRGKENALMEASEGGHLRVVKLLLKQSMQLLNHLDSHNRSALMKAARSGHLKTFRYLMSKSPRINFTDSSGNDLLMAAVSGGNLNIVKDIIEKHGFAIETINNNRSTPLLLAVRTGNTRIAKYLLSKGANVNVSSKHLLSPLQSTVSLNNKTLFKLILRKSDQTRIKDALLASARTGSTYYAKILYKKAKNKKAVGQHAFLSAARFGKVKTVDFFLKKGADINKLDSMGESALMLASMVPKTHKLLDYLIKKGANLNVRDKDRGRTAVMIALENKNYSAFKKLVASGADTKLPTKYKKNLLMESITGNHPIEIVRMLIPKSNVNAKDNFGASALYKAIFDKRKTIVNELINACAAINSRGPMGDSMIAVAKRYGTSEIVNLLKRGSTNPACLKK